MKHTTAYILFSLVIIVNMIFLFFVLGYTFELLEQNKQKENIVLDENCQGYSTAFPEKFLNYRTSEFYLKNTGVCE